MLSFEECMSLPPIENPLSGCFECSANMCEICKKPQYWYLYRDKTTIFCNLWWYGGIEVVLNKWREKILNETLNNS
jgi:hypothetical protein